MPDAVLTQEQLNKQLETLDLAWSSIPGSGLVRVFNTPNFKTGFALVGRIAVLAEEQNHHPDVTLGYDKVEVSLLTHSAGGVTAKDITLARAIDSLSV